MKAKASDYLMNRQVPTEKILNRGSGTTLRNTIGFMSEEQSLRTGVFM